jgi:hypothetical protein
MPKPADDAPLEARLGYFLSEYIDDAAPLNERFYMGVARAATQTLGLSTTSASEALDRVKAEADNIRITPKAGADLDNYERGVCYGFEQAMKRISRYVDEVRTSADAHPNPLRGEGPLVIGINDDGSPEQAPSGSGSES